MHHDSYYYLIVQIFHAIFTNLMSRVHGKVEYLCKVRRDNIDIVLS